MKTLAIILVWLLSCPVLLNAKTNQYFPTDDGFLFRSDGSGGIKIDPVKLEETKKSKESFPSEAYPEGNWGDIQNGFQLSLRFNKKSYASGEPVLATVLVRNTSDRVLKYSYFSFGGKAGDSFEFIVTRDKNVLMSPKADKTIVVSSRIKDIMPESQHKYVQRLDDVYELPKGEYTISVQLKVAREKDAGFLVVKSGKADIKITESELPK